MFILESDFSNPSAVGCKDFKIIICLRLSILTVDYPENSNPDLICRLEIRSNLSDPEFSVSGSRVLQVTV